jgi:hypothetical protein
MPRGKGRRVGQRIDFRSLGCAPVNEQGVVYLFGMLHDILDFTIESIQTGFPDCTARRDLGDGSAEELRVEFEFESRSFHRHGHDPLGADVIVCWKHNWADCPDHLEIIELSTLIDVVPPVKPKELSTYQRFCQEKRREGYSFSEIAALWHEGDRPSRSKKPKPKKPLSEWHIFCRDKRGEGLSFSEIAKLWHDQQKKQT